MDQPAKRFRYQARSIFLTYPKCPLSKLDVYNYLESRFLQLGAIIDKCCIVQESHADGDLHIHAAFWFQDKLRFSGADKLDIKLFDQ